MCQCHSTLFLFPKIILKNPTSQKNNYSSTTPSILLPMLIPTNNSTKNRLHFLHIKESLHILKSWKLDPFASTQISTLSSLTFPLNQYFFSYTNGLYLPPSYTDTNFSIAQDGIIPPPLTIMLSGNNVLINIHTF